MSKCEKCGHETTRPEAPLNGWIDARTTERPQEHVTIVMLFGLVVKSGFWTGTGWYRHDVGPCKPDAWARLPDPDSFIPSPLAPIWPDPEDWNLACPKCGTSPDGRCGWPLNCPTGLAKRHDMNGERT